MGATQRERELTRARRSLPLQSSTPTPTTRPQPPRLPLRLRTRAHIPKARRRPLCSIDCTRGGGVALLLWFVPRPCALLTSGVRLNTALLAQIILNIVRGMNWVWFGAIANSTAKEFNFTLDQVNWFGNVPHLSYLVFSWCVPVLVRRLGLRNTVCFSYSQDVTPNLTLTPVAVGLRILHSRAPLMDTRMRDDQIPVLNRVIRRDLGRSAPRGRRCPVFPGRRTAIRGSLVRSEGESHGDHDCSHMHVSICPITWYLADLFLQLTRSG